jgi:diaminohydroxyphosphoribosylaminopyrimidine deaminase/5-amino-6-(5-phosphoribosylamino)uracil reductase
VNVVQSIDEQHLHRAIRLAMNGRGLVEPNPMVGCVIVKDGRIIGEGFHQKFGEAHAEPNALASCTQSPEGATLYVTLEPCCHVNKKTPPCVPRLIDAKIARVVVGCLDPNPDVNGKGIAQLRAAGIQVDAPLLEAECKQLIAPFLHRIQFNAPYWTFKWAQSADGKVAGPGGKRIQISNAASSRQVQQLRSRCDAIVVGINTVVNDDPLLLPRDVPILRPCRRIVLDRRLRLPLDSQLVRSVARGPLVVLTSPLADPARVEQLQAAGVEVTSNDAYFEDPSLTHVLTEPGPTLARDPIETIDRLWVIQSPIIVGDNTAPSAAAIPDYFVKTGELNLDGDILTEYLNPRSDAYFAPVESADLVLARG